MNKLKQFLLSIFCFLLFSLFYIPLMGCSLNAVASSVDSLSTRATVPVPKQNYRLRKLNHFVAPFVSAGMLASKPAVIAGIGGVLIFNYQYYFGAYFMLKVTPLECELQGLEGAKVEYWHTGMLIGANIYFNQSQRSKRFHPNLMFEIGAGKLTITQEGTTPDSDQFIIVNPILEMEYRMRKWLWLGVGANYRVTAKISQNYTNRDFSGPGLFLNAKIRW